MSQADLADMAELDRSYLGRIERSEVLPGRPIRDRINQALGIDPTNPGYLLSLPPHERAVAQLASEEESLSPGQLIDRMLTFASGRERDMITEFVHVLNKMVMHDGSDGDD